MTANVIVPIEPTVQACSPLDAMIDERSWREALTDGTASTVLTETQFGQAWSIRAVVGLRLVDESNLLTPPGGALRQGFSASS
ncbi:hypothetical protein HYPDE_23333 [Hyphomicrobium denitrificans 1NES1]|uniref:Uncharacterized protein n=1 Tax=Hyphomicrobium denitrificans 1NES1 TaxID=670307 RepID=N0B0C5_9HYPH|nr:hypothetical protein [Hyphomicrobium denitrificans]AGK56353.1 hypothetical protein HYPDE_23333 [Hyphomicrobium denitrificans 1NES1]